VVTVSRTRVSGRSNGTPCQFSTIAWLDAPTPRMNRPGASCDTVPDAAAIVAGVRMYTGDTAMPMRADCVT
jgi:hypothetical protein